MYEYFIIPIIIVCTCFYKKIKNYINNYNNNNCDHYNYEQELYENDNDYFNRRDHYIPLS